MGRWTQQDPIGGSLFDPDSQNRYTYAGDNPVNFVDPTGAGILQNVILACAVGVTGAALVSAFAFAAFGQFELSIFDLAFGCVTSAATQLYLDQGNYVAAGETAVAGTIESLLSIISTFGG